MSTRQVPRLSMAHDQGVEDVLVHLDPCRLHHLQHLPGTLNIPNLKQAHEQQTLLQRLVPDSALISGTGRSPCPASRLPCSCLPVPEGLAYDQRFYSGILINQHLFRSKLVAIFQVNSEQRIVVVDCDGHCLGLEKSPYF